MVTLEISSGCTAERKPPHSGQQDPGTWRGNVLLKVSHQLPTFRLHPNLLFVPENKSTLFLMPQRKEKAGREKEGRKREGEGVRMDAS